MISSVASPTYTARQTRNLAIVAVAGKHNTYKNNSTIECQINDMACLVVYLRFYSVFTVNIAL